MRGADKLLGVGQGKGLQIHGKGEIRGIVPIPAVEDQLVDAIRQRGWIGGLQKDEGVILGLRESGGEGKTGDGEIFKEGKGIGEQIERLLAYVGAEIVQKNAVAALPPTVEGHSHTVIKTYDQLQKRSPSFQDLLYHVCS